jgi:hypothetical protein
LKIKPFRINTYTKVSRRNHLRRVQLAKEAKSQAQRRRSGRLRGATEEGDR